MPRHFSEPWFWRDDTLTARMIAAALTPLGALYDVGQRLRALVTKPARSQAPVICIGNATLGGVGKTPFAIMLAELLAKNGFSRRQDITFLTRGYGGALSGPVVVNPDRHSAADVGDEALLLAAARPTIVSRDRPQGANLAATLGARLIIMDDGYQNPTLQKDASILLSEGDGTTNHQYQNHRIFPAGPYREPLSRAAARADALVITNGGAPRIPFSGPVVRTAVIPQTPTPSGPLLAFCGIGGPQRFFETLRANGGDLSGTIAFPDHHHFSDADLNALKEKAARQNATLITTEKDYVRLGADKRVDITVYPISMTVDDPETLCAHLLSAIEARRPNWRENATADERREHDQPS